MMIELTKYQDYSPSDCTVFDYIGNLIERQASETLKDVRNNKFSITVLIKIFFPVPDRCVPATRRRAVSDRALDGASHLQVSDISRLSFFV